MKCPKCRNEIRSIWEDECDWCGLELSQVRKSEYGEVIGKCPKCHADRHEKWTECQRCGLIYDKWHGNNEAAEPLLQKKTIKSKLPKFLCPEQQSSKAELIVMWVLPPKDALEALGDMEEMRNIVQEKSGRRAASFWMWQQTLRSVGYYLIIRVADLMSRILVVPKQ